MEVDKAIRVLVIEDDPDDIFFLNEFLASGDGEGAQFHAEHAERLETGLMLLESREFDVVLLDLMLPDSRGLETFLLVHARRPAVPILVLTGLKDEQLALSAVRQGAQDYLVKGSMDARLLKRSIRYAIERKLLASRMENMIRDSADGMLVLDPEGQVCFVNPAAERILGRKAEQLLGRPFEPLARPGGRQELRIPFAEGEAKVAEMRVTETIWQGAPALLASIRDITELRRLEELKAEIRKRRELDELKDKFMNSVSHELRSPLAVVKVTIDNLRDKLLGGLNEEQAKMVEMAHKNMGRVMRMINNLLDLARLESGKAKMTRRRFSLTPLLLDMAECFQVADDGRKINLELDIAQDLPPVYADPDMLTQLLSNLLDNATRFAARRVAVKVQAAAAAPVEQGVGAAAGPASSAGAGPEKRYVQVTVADDGPGISQEHLGDLFNKFVQVTRASGSAGYKGTGLGLAICKEIVDQHQGRIWVESVVGRGARIHVMIPAYWE